MDVNIAKTIDSLPENLRPGTVLWFERLADNGCTISSDQVPDVARAVACSEFAGRVLLREWRWFSANAISLSKPPDVAQLEAFAETIATSDADVESVKAELRRFRNRYLLHVYWREVLQLADLNETLSSLSLLADRLLEAAMRYAESELRPKFGQVRNADGQPVPLVILGMGKLGGRELNFSSDIDIIFCYSEQGQSDGNRQLSAQEYFTHLARRIIGLMDETTVEGFVFRTDTRLRPFGDSGPPVVSFAALESYLLQHGRDWERYAYVKARIVGAKPRKVIVSELHDELIRPFVYRRYIDYGVFESVREMQALIAADVQRRELKDNVKLGPGGIREAEFIVQALQLVRGGSEPALQHREFQTVLPRLIGDRSLSEVDATKLGEAYRFLRRLENFIQAIRDEQTHDLPENERDRERLRLAMDYTNWTALMSDLNDHRDTISAQFHAVAIRTVAENASAEKGSDLLSNRYSTLWKQGASETEWANAFAEDAASESAALAKIVTRFAASSTHRQVDSISRQRLRRFMPNLLSLVVASHNSPAALTRTLDIVEKVLRRSAYLALLNENPLALSRLVDLSARSDYIAAEIARFPALLDELLDPGIYGDSVTKAEMSVELERRLKGVAVDDSEIRMQALAQFQRAAMFRIAVADFNDQLPIMKVSDGLTWLAELVLEQALDAAWADLTEKHGVPRYVVDGVSQDAGFGIVAYGKLGGIELSYGSDLDIVFLHDSSGSRQRTDGKKPLDNSLFFSRLVRRLVHFLTAQTGSGELYEIDTRLRPDGRSGLLVTNTEAFEKYQEENAWTWEHQALLRARAVAGSTKIASEFERIRRETLTNRVRRDDLRDDVISMRRRMREKLDSSDNLHFDLKHGIGGIGDIEFLVQYWVLRAADAHALVIAYTDNIRQLDALVDASIIMPDVGEKLQDIYRAYRLHLHRLVLNGEKPAVEADSFAAERDFVQSIWQKWLGDRP